MIEQLLRISNEEGVYLRLQQTDENDLGGYVNL
jgi:hypothetical protein